MQQTPTQPAPSARLNINQSDRDAMAADPVIGPDVAQAIVEARPFANWSDLERAGIDADLVRRLQDGGAELGAPSFTGMSARSQMVRPTSGNAARSRQGDV